MRGHRRLIRRLLARGGVRIDAKAVWLLGSHIPGHHAVGILVPCIVLLDKKGDWGPACDLRFSDHSPLL